MIRKIINKLNAAIHYTAMGIIGILILLVVVWVYASIKVNWAQKQVEQFGKAATIGAPITGLKKKAEELHLNYQPQSDSNDKSGKFYVWEGFAFSRWFCDVEYQDGKVVKQNVHHLD